MTIGKNDANIVNNNADTGTECKCPNRQAHRGSSENGPFIPFERARVDVWFYGSKVTRPPS
jgi:hypothetical protein